MEVLFTATAVSGESKLSMRIIFLVVAIFPLICDTRRYRACDEGCCVHEYCAYHRICYPRIHCDLGCPDGRCVGQASEPSGGDPPAEVYRYKRHRAAAGSENQRQHPDKPTPEDQYISERYSYQDSPVDNGQDVNNERHGVAVDENVLADDTAADDNSNGEPSLDSTKTSGRGTDGICMPFPPCHEGDYCGMGHSCTFNYNLGYHTCQYNLEIGSTLCYDSKGNPALTPLS